MSAEDAQNTFKVDPNLMIEGYTQRLANSQQNEVRLEAAVNQLMNERVELLRQNGALQQQVDALLEQDRDQGDNAKSNEEPEALLKDLA